MIDTQQVLCAAGGLSINWKKYQFLKRRDSGAPNTCESKESWKVFWIYVEVPTSNSCSTIDGITTEFIFKRLSSFSKITLQKKDVPVKVARWAH